jgi:hypothetical protein
MSIHTDDGREEYARRKSSSAAAQRIFPTQARHQSPRRIDDRTSLFNLSKGGELRSHFFHEDYKLSIDSLNSFCAVAAAAESPVGKT